MWWVRQPRRKWLKDRRPWNIKFRNKHSVQSKHFTVSRRYICNILYADISVLHVLFAWWPTQVKWTQMRRASFFHQQTNQGQRLQKVFCRSVLQTEACLCTLVSQHTLKRRIAEILEIRFLSPTETHHRWVTKTVLLRLFGNSIAVYCNNHKKYINALCV
jgi:hypothetical protein